MSSSTKMRPSSGKVIVGLALSLDHVQMYDARTGITSRLFPSVSVPSSDCESANEAEVGTALADHTALPLALCSEPEIRQNIRRSNDHARRRKRNKSGGGSFTACQTLSNELLSVSDIR